MLLEEGVSLLKKSRESLLSRAELPFVRLATDVPELTSSENYLVLLLVPNWGPGTEDLATRLRGRKYR